VPSAKDNNGTVVGAFDLPPARRVGPKMTFDELMRATLLDQAELRAALRRLLRYIPHAAIVEYNGRWYKTSPGVTIYDEENDGLVLTALRSRGAVLSG